MKLLKLKIEEKFRSLHEGFEIDFHTLEKQNEMNEFRPFCFAGLNGSGKSNVLEVLSNIFYHLELCGNKFKPEGFKGFFKPEESTPNSFEILYLIGLKGELSLKNENMVLVSISKERHQVPVMNIKNYPFSPNENWNNIPTVSTYEEPANSKAFLPDIIVGYSSGENQILSLPFMKTRLIRYDEYMQRLANGGDYIEPESSLIYIDSEMSQAVLLANLLFQKEETLKPLKKELGILGMNSFRVHLNLHRANKEFKEPKIIDALESRLNKIKHCSTSWFEINNRLVLDFLVDDEMKKAFRYHFDDAFDLFRFFQMLYELNHRVVDKEIKHEIYQTASYHLEGKLPIGGADDKVFHFIDFFILKDIKGEKKPIDLLLRNFSDGEHQFLHSMGILLLAKEKRSLFLLDEPETHFNPGWRAKFIKVLNDSIKASNSNNLLKDVLLTSHSPFIISDCKQDNVIYFEKNGTGEVEAKSATTSGFNTYGASVDLVLQEIFNMNHTISDHALEEINLLLGEETISTIIEGSKKFGESYEKGFLYAKIEELKQKHNKK